MKRFALLTFAAAVLVLPSGVGAMPTDGVPLMPVGDMKALPGTPVPITLPAQPKPCAPLAKVGLTTLPGAPVVISVPALRK